VALLIEDHADSREMLRQMLEAIGARAIVAEDGRDALRQLTATTPDVILCDLLMPELDGFGFIRELRTRPEWRGVPVLAVTALGSDTDYRRTWEAGFDGHLTKPIQASQLEAVIEAVTRRSRPGPSSTAG
jgi:two-component system, OmpR family, phosphate regulon response regulator PhoB